MDIIKIIDINKTHLIDDGDVTGNVSSIVKQTYEPIPDGSYTAFKFKNKGTKLIYSNYTNGLYDNNLNSLSEIETDIDFYTKANLHTNKKTKSNKPAWLRILFGYVINCT